MNLFLVLALIAGDPWTPPPGYDYWIGYTDNLWRHDNWSTPFVPGGVGEELLFGHDFSHPEYSTTVNMESTPRTVGNLIFVQDRSITLQGTRLNLNNGALSSTLNVSGTHTISAPVVIDSNTLVSGTGMLNMTGGISGNRTLTVSGTLKAKNIQVNRLNIGNFGAQNVVPEPGGIALLLTGALGFLAWRRRRRR